jgi:cytochrome c peroxidase
MNSLFSLLVCVGSLAWCGQSLGADIKEQIPKLRADAKTILGPLPDRMPGAENDTPALVELGRRLYFETQLSANNSQSCNTCHDIENQKGGVDNEPTSDGAFNKRGDRNSPTTFNAGFHFVQFWDGRASNLVEQAKGPILNPVEMAMASEAEVVKRLSAVPEYRDGFAKAFPAAAEKISYHNVAVAIAAFERTLITRDRFDDFQNGNDAALSSKELHGLALFLNTGCTTCHSGPTLGGRSFQKVGLVHPYATPDKGRSVVTKDEDDDYKFKVPSLRNIALTAPYFHDGKQPDLKGTTKLMAHLQLDRQLTEDELGQLVAFLGALSDKTREK